MKASEQFFFFVSSRNMIIDRYVFDLHCARICHVGKCKVEKFDRDPDKIWIGTSKWYLDLSDFSLTYDDKDENLSTSFSADPSILLQTQLLNFGDRTPDGQLVKEPTVTWFEICNQLATNPAFRFEFCVLPNWIQIVSCRKQRLIVLTGS